MTGVLAHSDRLPVGTQLSFTTAAGSSFTVEVVEPEGSHTSPFVEVRVTNPSDLFDDSTHPIHMLFIAADEFVETLDDAYVAANYKLYAGDRVYLALNDMPIDVRVTAVNITEPALA